MAPEEIGEKGIHKKPGIMFSSEETMPFERHDDDSEKQTDREAPEQHRHIKIPGNPSLLHTISESETERDRQNEMGEDSNKMRFAPGDLSSKYMRSIGILDKIPGAKTRRNMRQERHNRAGTTAC